jgi:hypothetical protein
MFLSLYDKVTNNLTLARVVDFLRERVNVSRTHSTISSDTGGLPELLPLHKQPVSLNFML